MKAQAVVAVTGEPKEVVLPAVHLGGIPVLAMVVLPRFHDYDEGSGGRDAMRCQLNASCIYEAHPDC